jgi:microsomal dipeptidase-like Zn-dependent dipeptidase
LEDTTGSESEILRNLEELHYRGVASLTLAHFYPNKTVMPTFPYPEFTLPILPQHHVEQLWADIDLTRGLTVTGERVVEKMIELGMLIDVSHCTPVARQRIYHKSKPLKPGGLGDSVDS